MASTQAFINQELPAARAASSRLGIPVSVILAQWINETGSGSSQAFVDGNNYAGVSYLDSPEVAVGATLGASAPILSYPTRAAGVAGYIARWLEPVYASTRKSWGTTTDPIAIAKSIEASPWAAGHYGGSGLENLITQNNLTAYDDPNATPGNVSTTAKIPGTDVHIPGTGSGSSLLPDAFSGITDWLENGLMKTVITGLAVSAGLGLIVLGIVRAAAPRVRDAEQHAQAAAPLVAAAL